MSDAKGKALFDEIRPISGQTGEWQLRFLYHPFWPGSELGQPVLSALSEPFSFSAHDFTYKVRKQPPPSIVIGERFATKPVIRIETNSLTSTMEKGFINFVVLVQSSKSLLSAGGMTTVPANLTAVVTARKFHHQICSTQSELLAQVAGSGGVVGDGGRSCRVVKAGSLFSPTLSQPLRRRFFVDVEVDPLLVRAAPGESFKFSAYSTDALYSLGVDGRDVPHSKATRTVTVSDSPSRLQALNEPPPVVRVGELYPFQVVASNNGDPVANVAVTAKLVASAPPSANPGIAFIMKMFQKFKSTHRCFSNDEVYRRLEEIQGATQGASSSPPSLGDLVEQGKGAAAVVAAEAMAAAETGDIDALKQRAMQQASAMAEAAAAQASALKTDVFKQAKLAVSAVLDRCADSGDGKAATPVYRAKLAQLRKDTAQRRTGRDGTARFALAINHGVTGWYQLQFEWDKDSRVKSSMSPPFQLLNDVVKVDIVDFAGVPSSNCNGWRWKMKVGDNCVLKKEFQKGGYALEPFDLALKGTAYRVGADGEKSFVDTRAVEGTFRVVAVPKGFTPGQKPDFSKQIAGAANVAMGSEGSPYDRAKQMVNLVIEGAKMLKASNDAKSKTSQGVLHQDGVALKDGRVRASYDEARKVFVAKNLHLVVYKGGTYSLFAYGAGVMSERSADIVVEQINPSSWQFVTVNWLIKLAMFATFATVYAGNAYFDESDKMRVPPSLVISIAVVIGLWVYAQNEIEEHQPPRAVEKAFVVGAISLLILAGLIGSLIAAVLGRTMWTFAERRKACYYRYVRRLFSDPQGSWYHGHREQEVRALALKIVESKMKANSKVITKLEKIKYTEKNAHTRFANDGEVLRLKQQNAIMQAVFDRVGLMEKAEDRVGRLANTTVYELANLDTNGKNESTTAGAVQAAAVRASLEDMAAMNSKLMARLDADPAQATAVVRSLKFSHAKQNGALLAVRGYLFDIAYRHQLVTRIWQDAESAYWKKNGGTFTQFKCILLGLRDNKDAFYVPGRMLMASALSIMVRCQC